MRFSVVFVAVLATALGTAAADQLPPPKPTATMSPAQVAKLLAFFDKLMATMKASAGDCPKMGKNLDALITANVAVLREMKKLEAEGKQLPPADLKALEERFAKDATALQACLGDPSVVAAFGRLEDPDRKPPPPPPPPAAAADLAQVKPPVAADLEGYVKSIPGKGELMATIVTPQGTVKCQLRPDKAPITVANFVGLATGKKNWLDPTTNKLKKNKPYYNGLIFHRVIPEFMIQGGDPLGTGMGGPGYTFADEQNDLKMAPGVLAMANAGPATNGSQFFITDGTPSHLDGKHTIFGTCKQLDVVGKIARVATGERDMPSKPVKMKVTISRGTP
jgi:peptidyl-prolyl cis-trans isomerase A (cyclophilin A)